MVPESAGGVALAGSRVLFETNATALAGLYNHTAGVRILEPVGSFLVECTSEDVEHLCDDRVAVQREGLRGDLAIAHGHPTRERLSKLAVMGDHHDRRPGVVELAQQLDALDGVVAAVGHPHGAAADEELRQSREALTQVVILDGPLIFGSPLRPLLPTIHDGLLSVGTLVSVHIPLILIATRGLHPLGSLPS